MSLGEFRESQQLTSPSRTFYQALRVAAGPFEFVWVDVACIDQESEAIKMDEINHQAAIYQRASQTFAWLTPWTTAQVHQAVHVLDEFDAQVNQQKRKVQSIRLVPPKSQGPVDISAAHVTLRALKQHGWFTSLWTLQEGFLSRPWLLSRSAECVYMQPYLNGQFIGGKFELGIDFVSAICKRIFETLRYSQNPTSKMICRDITDSGLLCMAFRKAPHLMLPAALRRYVTEPHDTVYAIMHVFGIRLPSIDNVRELSERLAVWVWYRNPVSYQIFIHEQPVAPLDAWRMSSKTHLPYQFFSTAIHTPCGKIEANQAFRPEFTGCAPTLADIWSYWTKVQNSRRSPGQVAYRPVVFLDAIGATVCRSLELCEYPEAPDDPELPHFNDAYTVRMSLQDLEGAFTYPMGSYRVLVLGTSEFDVSEAGKPVCFQAKYFIGLIVRQVTSGQRQPWSRIGFCTWLNWSQKVREVNGLEPKDEIKVLLRN